MLGVHRVRSKSIRGAAEVNIDFTPGTDMIQALNDVRAKMAEVGSQFPAGTCTIVERQTPSIFPIISFVVTGGRDPSALHDYAYYDLRPRISRIHDVSYVTVQGGDIREIIVEAPARPPAGRRPVHHRGRRSAGQGAPAQGRRPHGPRAPCSSRSSPTRKPRPRTRRRHRELENLVIADIHGQSIRLGNLGHVVIGHEDRTMAIRAKVGTGPGRRGPDRLPPPGRQRPGRLPRAADSAGRRPQVDAPPGIKIIPVYDQAT